MLECIIPILNVRDLHASCDYYANVLGFRKDWLHDSDDYRIAGVSRDQCSIDLCQGAQGRPGVWIWIGVEDVEVLYQELQVRGAKVLHQPTNYPWALEMRVEDPDGHVLRFGSEPKRDPRRTT